MNKMKKKEVWKIKSINESIQVEKSSWFLWNDRSHSEVEVRELTGGKFEKTSLLQMTFEMS
jgi:hypothetical protein